MNIEEVLAREGIRKSLADYTMAGDRLKVDDFVSVFTEDAILESEGVPQQDSFRYVGGEEIRRWLTRWQNKSGTELKAHEATFVRHHLTSCQIEITTAKAARARTYWIAYTDIGPDHSGYYVDEFSKVHGNWLIAHRRIRLDWQSEESLFKTAIVRTKKD